MRIALGIEYDGAANFGWQRQREVPSIQEHLEIALTKIAAQPIELSCAGRTDAGVHATGQVVHFDCSVERPLKAWTMGVNANLPQTIAVTWAQAVDAEFHARFSATHRRYRYVIYNNKARPAIHHQGITHIHNPLNATLMHEAAQQLLGEQDFSAFRASLCQSKTPFRNVTEVSVYRYQDYVVMDIQANAFLHHMVRNIIGTLVMIGAQQRPVEWVSELLAGKDRSKAAPTAKPNGLYLVEVSYPHHFNIPAGNKGPLFLPIP